MDAHFGAPDIPHDRAGAETFRMSPAACRVIATAEQCRTTCGAPHLVLTWVRFLPRRRHVSRVDARSPPCPSPCIEEQAAAGDRRPDVGPPVEDGPRLPHCGSSRSRRPLPVVRMVSSRGPDRRSSASVTGSKTGSAAQWQGCGIPRSRRPPTLAGGTVFAGIVCSPPE